MSEEPYWIEEEERYMTEEEVEADLDRTEEELRLAKAAQRPEDIRVARRRVVPPG